MPRKLIPLVAVLLLAAASPAHADCQPVNCVKPSATTGPPANVSSTTATLTGTVNTMNSSTGTYTFELGTTDANLRPVASGPVPESPNNFPVSFNATGLAPGTNYEYRVVITSSWGTVRGDLVTFGTPLMGGAPAQPAQPATPAQPAAPANPVAPEAFTAGTPDGNEAAAPYRYRIRGRLAAPNGVTDACSGKVTIRVQRGASTLQTVTVNVRQVSGTCRYDKTLTLVTSGLAHDGRQHSLRVVAAFGGNAKLSSTRAPAFRIFYG
jgi:hypothetical protein